MRVLVDTEQLRAEEHTDERVVVVRRSSVSAGDGTALLAAYQDLATKLRPEHKRFGLLIDTRLAPGRSDPRFEGSVAKLVNDAEKRFARIVILVASATGELQARRLDRERHGNATITRDEQLAFDIASGRSVPPSAIRGS